MLKDLGLALETGQRAGVSLPLGSVAQELFSRAAAQGLGDKHTSAVVEVYRERALVS